MKYYLNIYLSGAAFEESARFEIARILRELADEITAQPEPVEPAAYPIRDGNGNTCGVNGYAEIQDDGGL